MAKRQIAEKQTQKPKESFEARMNREIDAAIEEETRLREAFHAAQNRKHALIDMKRNPPWMNFSSAIACSYVDRAKEILAERPELIRLMNDEGIPVIAQPAYDGNEKTFDFLLSHGADVNIANEIGRTPLYYAAQRDNDTIFKKLLLAGARLDVVTTDGETIHSVAKAMGSEKVLQVLKDRGFMASVAKAKSQSAPIKKTCLKR